MNWLWNAGSAWRDVLGRLRGQQGHDLQSNGDRRLQSPRRAEFYVEVEIANYLAPRGKDLKRARAHHFGQFFRVVRGERPPVRWRPRVLSGLFHFVDHRRQQIQLNQVAERPRAARIVKAREFAQ